MIAEARGLVFRENLLANIIQTYVGFLYRSESQPRCRRMRNSRANTQAPPNEVLWIHVNTALTPCVTGQATNCRLYISVHLAFVVVLVSRLVWMDLALTNATDKDSIVLYLNTCYSAPTRFPIQRRSRLLRERWIGVSRRSAWAIASEGLAPYAAALRRIRTRNPPAARHRTYPYTTAPQYIVLCCVLYNCTPRL